MKKETLEVFIKYIMQNNKKTLHNLKFGFIEKCKNEVFENRNMEYKDYAFEVSNETSLQIYKQLKIAGFEHDGSSCRAGDYIIVKKQISNRKE